MGSSWTLEDENENENENENDNEDENDFNNCLLLTSRRGITPISGI